MEAREKAMQWFNDKDTYNKSELSHKYYKDSISYNFTSLTGREIEEIWRKETQTENIYLNKLKEQYRNFYSTKYSRQKEVEYEAVCLFCINTNLISLEEIQAMQSEVISSF